MRGVASLCCALIIQVQRCQSLVPFSNYKFASNGVCIQPSLFFEAATQRSYTLRNVPGTGDCMFSAVALASLTSLGLGGNNALLNSLSKDTRNVVASVLESSNGGSLVITRKRVVDAATLLRSASRQEGISNEDYLCKLRLTGPEGGLWGGGPELTVLSNVLRRPISIYEVDPQSTNDNKPNIICQGVFGEDFFHDPLDSLPRHAAPSAVLDHPWPGAFGWHLHILVVDASLREKHACVLLPQPIITK
jgi:OTU-like cysteine protease